MPMYTGSRTLSAVSHVCGFAARDGDRGGERGDHGGPLVSLRLTPQRGAWGASSGRTKQKVTDGNRKAPHGAGRPPWAAGSGEGAPQTGASDRKQSITVQTG